MVRLITAAQVDDRQSEPAGARLRRKRTVRNEDQLANAKFSIFAGWELTGWPIVTIRRGQVVYEGGKILAAAGSGQLAPRQHWQRKKGRSRA
jgi:hypothetical protein